MIREIRDISGKNQVILQIFFILLLTIVLRAATFDRCHYISPDEFAYFLAAGEIYKAILANDFSYLQTIDTYHLPLIPIQIASVFLLIGKTDILTGRLLVETYNIMSVPLTYILAYTISGNKKISFFSSLLFAFNQAFWVNADRIWLDSPSAFFVLLFLILFFSAIKKRDSRYGICSGIVLALLLMTKEYMLIFLYPIILLAVFIEIRRSKDARFPAKLIFYNIAIPVLFIIFYTYSSGVMPSSSFVAGEADGGVYHLNEFSRLWMGFARMKNMYIQISAINIPSIVLFLAAYGMLISYKKRFHLELIALTLLFIIIFGRRLGGPDARYLFPVYPLLYIFATYTIFNIAVPGRSVDKNQLSNFFNYKNLLCNYLKITVVIGALIFTCIDVYKVPFSPKGLLFPVAFASIIYLSINIFNVRVKNTRLLKALRAACILTIILFSTAYMLNFAQSYEIKIYHLGPELGWDNAGQWVGENINSSTRILSNDCIYMSKNSNLSYKWYKQDCKVKRWYKYSTVYDVDSINESHINNFIIKENIDFLILSRRSLNYNISSSYEKLRDFDNLEVAYRQEKEGNLQIAILRVVRND